MNLGLSQRVALVTGSSRGIGRATAESFAQEGALVAITYKQERERAEELASSIRASGGDAVALHFDLCSIASGQACVEEIVRRWGRLDILVNNAVAWGSRHPDEEMFFAESPLGEWMGRLQTNIEGTVAITQSAIPHMRARRWGRIVTVSSVLAADGLVRTSWYATAKSAFHGFTRALAKEVGPDGILANVVLPGATSTDRLSMLAPAVRKHLAQTQPIRRLLEPADVASIIVYLSSSANTAITGEVVRASGGRP